MTDKFLFIILVVTFLNATLSGCVLLVVPGAALIGHTIQKNNAEYDNIIVNFGYKYKEYYSNLMKTNKENEALGKPKEEIIEFSDWIETQAKSVKEKKAVTRYKRIKNN